MHAQPQVHANAQIRLRKEAADSRILMQIVRIAEEIGYSPPN